MAGESARTMETEIARIMKAAQPCFATTIAVCCFSILPLELRWDIYDLFLLDPAVEVVDPYKYTRGFAGPVRFLPGFDARILRVCQFLYHDAANYLYARTNFRFTTPYSLLRFNRPLSADCFSTIKHLGIEISRRSVANWISHFEENGEAMLEGLKSLKHVNITLIRWHGRLGGCFCYCQRNKDLIAIVNQIAASGPQVVVKGFCTKHLDELAIQAPKVHLV